VTREGPGALVAAGLVVWVVTGVCALGAEARSGVADAVEPVLTIQSPRSGETVTPPWPVRYAVSGLRVGPTHPVRILVSLAGLNRMVHLTAARQTGVVDVPDDRFFSGRRDVVFTLLRGDGTPYTNKGASYTLTNLIIAGSR
jgi:hypothetical protein